MNEWLDRRQRRRRPADADEGHPHAEVVSGHHAPPLLQLYSTQHIIVPAFISQLNLKFLPARRHASAVLASTTTAAVNRQLRHICRSHNDARAFPVACPSTSNSLPLRFRDPSYSTSNLVISNSIYIYCISLASYTASGEGYCLGRL